MVIKGIDEKTIKDFDKTTLKMELKELIEAGLSLSAASKYLAKKKGISKSTIYNLY